MAGWHGKSNSNNNKVDFYSAVSQLTIVSTTCFTFSVTGEGGGGEGGGGGGGQGDGRTEIQRCRCIQRMTQPKIG